MALGNRNDWKPDSLEGLRWQSGLEVKQDCGQRSTLQHALAQAPFGPCALALPAARLMIVVCSVRSAWA